jgi:hypothetical protein
MGECGKWLMYQNNLNARYNSPRINNTPGTKVVFASFDFKTPVVKIKESTTLSPVRF